MNLLSLLIYLASFLGELSHVTKVMSSISGVLFIILGIAAFVTSSATKEESYYSSEEIKVFKEDFTIFVKSLWKKTGVVFTCLLLLSIVVPSRDTVYMIAASELGEEAINTPEFEKLREIIRERLDDILEEAHRKSQRPNPF